MIRLHEVSKVYTVADGIVNAILDVECSISENDFVIVMGESGSGKSTLLQIIAGIQKPTSGIYEYQNQIVNEWGEKHHCDFRRNHVGFIFQQFHLLPYLNVLENVLLPMKYSNLDFESQLTRANDLLRLVNLFEQKTQFPHQLSGGQKQRACIARSLANRPQLLLCDEPTGALDLESSNEVIKIIKLLHQYGTTIIMVTHNMDYAKLGNRLLVVSKGKLKEIWI